MAKDKEFGTEIKYHTLGKLRMGDRAALRRAGIETWRSSILNSYYVEIKKYYKALQILDKRHAELDRGKI